MRTREGLMGQTYPGTVGVWEDGAHVVGVSGVTLSDVEGWGQMNTMTLLWGGPVVVRREEIRPPGHLFVSCRFCVPTLANKRKGRR
jgi:hypothetical protein